VLAGRDLCGSGTCFHKGGSRGVGRLQSGVCPADEAFSDEDVANLRHAKSGSTGVNCFLIPSLKIFLALRYFTARDNPRAS
jgi:hypothetical protein